MTRRKPQGKQMTEQERKDAKKRFLIMYSRCGNWTQSCERAGISLTQARKWVETDPKFKNKFDQMADKFVDMLEMVAVQRAVDKSDTLLLALLKANRPQKYRENVKVDADVNQQTRINLVFSADEIGDMPNYAFQREEETHNGEQEETGESE